MAGKSTLGLAILTLACAPAAIASDLEEVKRVFERTAAVECEIIVMRYQVLGLGPGASQMQLQAQLNRRTAQASQDAYARAVRMRDSLGRLKDEERQALARHTEQIVEKCQQDALREYRARVEAGTAQPPPQPPQNRPPGAVAPNRPPGGAIERQAPAPR